ncbi:Protein IQ-DOMAIN 2 [Linum perenne]
MGRKGSWFSSVKKAFSPESKKSKKKKLLAKQNLETNSAPVVNVTSSSLSPPLPPQPEEVKVLEETINVQNDHHHGHALPIAAEVPEPVVPVVRQTNVVAKKNKYAGKSKEEAAAIRIQTIFRGYLARRALRALRGLVRLKLLMEGPAVKRQAVHTLRCMQTLARVQNQIHTRRVRMSEENQALQRQLLQKHLRELESLRMKEGWDASLQSKEQIESKLLSKYEATMRRERALAYSFSHQQNGKNTAKAATGMFMTPGNPSWGWSWLERWMSAHPWEARNTTDKELSNDQASVKSGSRSLVGGEISRAYARYQLNSDKLSPVDNQANKAAPTRSTTHSPSTTSKPPSSIGRKMKPASPRSSVGGPDDDSRSMVSFQSHRRHSIAGSSVRDDESCFGSSPSLPSYMVPTQSAKAKSRLQSPLGLGAEKNGGSETSPPEKEKGPMASAKKKLSYPPSSPARPRRHSGPPKVDTSLIKTAGKVVAI